jgi:uncharacterized SAM-binding protein YcdF (DUF218 family)
VILGHNSFSGISETFYFIVFFIWYMFFLIKKILTNIILPPGIFIVVLTILGVRLIFSKRRMAGLACMFVALGLWGLSIAPVSNRLAAGLESKFPQPEFPQGDVIILLGAGYSLVPDLTGMGFPKSSMLGRIVTAARLQQKLDIPLIVSSGTGRKDIPADAVVAKRFLVDLGVDEERVICETKSRDTYENAKYSKEICSKYGFTHPILITSADHLKRAVMIFEKLGMQVTPFPAYYRSRPNIKYSWMALFPYHENFSDSVRALHEYLGHVYYQWVY